MKYLTLMLILCVGIFGQAQNNDKQPEKYGVMDDELPNGLAVGQEAPDIVLIDQYSENFRLSEALEEGPVVLTFYRGNWCRHCSKYLSQLSASAEKISKLGAKLVAVSPEKEAEIVRTHKENFNGEIILLSDRENQVMKDYDVDYKVTNKYQARLDKTRNIDLKEHNKQEIAELPVAATYVIDSDGKIAYRHFDLDYSQRAQVKEILEVLQEL